MPNLINVRWPSRKLNNILSLSGIALTLVGLLHIPVWLFDSGSWDGQVSWRKPILFGVSTGVTLISLGWLQSNLTSSLIDRCWAWIVSVSLTLEVALITVQQWRSKPSHFNQTTNLDAAIDNAMLALITIAFAGIVYFTARSFTAIRVSSDYRLAMRAGMLFLLISCCIGFAISFYGYNRVSAGLSPETVGDRGVTKFPHGVAIHALQVFPAVVFVSQKLGMALAHRRLIVWSLICSFALQIAFACYQTISGSGRFEINTVAGTVLALLSIGIPAGALLIALTRLFRASSETKQLPL